MPHKLRAFRSGRPLAKNITLAIDEDLLDKVRVLAAIKRTSVNEMVRQFLEREVKRETAQATRADVWGRIFQAADAGSKSDTAVDLSGTAHPARGRT